MRAKIFLTLLLTLWVVMIAPAQNKKLSKADKAKLTQDQRIAYDNDRAHKKKSKKPDTVKAKVKRAKKNDKASRRQRKPKK